MLSGQLKEIEDTREFKEGVVSPTDTLNDSPASSPKCDNNKRKFSCDSGVADNSSDSDEHSQTPTGTGTPESSARTTPIPEEDESVLEETIERGKKEGDNGYNLRHRK